MSTLAAGGRSLPDIGPRTADRGALAASDLTASPEELLLVAALMLACLAWYLAAPRAANMVAALTTGAATLALWAVDAVPPAAWFFLALAVLGVALEVRATPGVAAGGLGAGAAVLFSGHAVGAYPGHVAVALLAAGLTAGTTLRAGRLAGRKGTLPPDPLAGAVGFTLEAHGRNGRAVVAGELWPVRSAAGPLIAGSCVEVLREADGVLLVAPARSR